jgi:prepilin-type processing-associated H-X9-DG protein
VPPASWEIDLRSGKMLSWMVLVLPYIEGDILFNKFDLSKTALEQPLDPQAMQLPFMLCPSDAAQGRMYMDTTFTKGKVFAKGNYAAYCSPFHVDLQHLWPGAIAISSVQLNSGQRKDDIRDGIFCTIMLSEVRTRPNEQDQRGVWALPWTGASLLAFDMHDASGSIGTFVPADYSKGETQPPNNDERHPNMDMLYACPDLAGTQLDHMPCGVWDYGPMHWLSAAPRSLHPRGVNVVFADGHVKFLPNDVDETAMALMISINDGRTVDQDQFVR